MPLLRSVVRRALRAASAVTALGLAFTAGVVAGAGSSPPPEPPPGVLDDAAAQIAASALRPVDRSALDAAAVEGMLAVAGDPWATRTLADGAAGVGLWLRPGAAGAVVVGRVGSRSPAAGAGVRPGDVVRGVDDRTVRGLAAPRVAALLRGPSGSLVRLTLARGTAVRTVALRRAALAEPALVTTDDRAGVLRIAVAALEQGVGRQVRSTLAAGRADGVRGVVLDLRGNPGGRLDEAVEVASAFLDDGPVVSYAGRGGAPRRLEAVGDGDTTTPLVVLVDGGTASAAEVVAAALQDRGRAVLVGARTFGKGSVQEPRPLVDGSALALTVARWTPPSGRKVEGVGLAPDIEVAAGAPPETAARRADEVLTGLLAGAGGRG